MLAFGKNHDFCTAASPIVTISVMICYVEGGQESRRKRTTPKPKRSFKLFYNYFKLYKGQSTDPTPQNHCLFHSGSMLIVYDMLVFILRVL